jgi:hypothetical protein
MGEFETADRGSAEALLGNALMKSAMSTRTLMLNFRIRPKADLQLEAQFHAVLYCSITPSSRRMPLNNARMKPGWWSLN